MLDKLRLLAIFVAALPLGSCVVYEPVPVASPQPTMQERYDRSWNAAAGAMSDQGLAITMQDRGAGVIRGSLGGTTITATVTTLPDGRIQVSFDSSGGSYADPALVDRVTASYNRRMGR